MLLSAGTRRKKRFHPSSAVCLQPPKSTQNKTMAIWLLDHPGQLGNQLATFAHLIGHAINTRQTIYNPPFRRYADLYPYFERNFLCRYPTDATSFSPLWLENAVSKAGKRLLRSSRVNQNLKVIHYISLDVNEEIDLNNLFKTENTLTSPSLIALDGWMFRDYGAIDQHRLKIKRILSFNKLITDSVDTWLGSIRAESRPLIGLHVRKGDFKEHCPYLYFSDDFYNSLAKRISGFFSHPPIFVVCSNEEVPDSLTKSLDFTLGLGGISEDLYTLSQCDYIAGPLSTFSSWASFHGEVPAYLAKSATLPESIADFSKCRYP